MPHNVVVTAASSGIGRATAEAFAAAGARLVIAARGQEGLEEVAAACRARGAAEVHVVPTDVGDREQVQRLADAALGALGTIDLWASIAGVGALGRFHEVPMAAHEATIRTNLLGHMNEAHAALPIFIGQGRGVFVNMISLGGFASTPFAAAYGASKFGLKGLSEALRGELAGHPAIHVCDVYPSFIDTPGIAHAANYTGKALSVPPPVVDARRVAAAIVRLADHPRATVMVGSPTYALRLGHWLAPTLTAKGMYAFIAGYLKQADPAPVTDGNLFDAPARAAAVDGGLRSPPERRAAAIGTVTTLAVGAGIAGLALWARSRREEG